MPENATQDTDDTYGCKKIPDPPDVPPISEPTGCPPRCSCPVPPGGEPQSCIEGLIQDQNVIVKTAERAKAFADELTAIQEKLKSAQVEYTQARYVELLTTWKEQDAAIVELIRKLVCAINCWECLLDCRLCRQLVGIRRLEDRLYGGPGTEAAGTGPLTEQVYSLYDQQAWHQRNVVQMKSRLQRITAVMAAWEKPAGTLADVLEKNGTLIKEAQNLISTDPAKALYDVFMTLVPTHWAIRPRDGGPGNQYGSDIDAKYRQICDCPRPAAPPPADNQQGCDGNGDNDQPCLCDDGLPDDCCGPDVGILSLRERLVGPLPYIVEPVRFPAILCCLTTQRLSPASRQLAAAEAALAASTATIELVLKQIADQTAAIEATFRAELGNPIDCKAYQPAPAAPGTKPSGPTVN